MTRVSASLRNYSALKTSPFRITALLAVVAALAVTSCSFRGGSDSAAGKCELKIGVLEPLSGAAASLGQPVMQGVQAAVDHVNSTGGADGCTVTLDSQDYKSEPATAVTRVRRLIGDKVYGIIGPNQGSATLAIDPIIRPAKIPICAFNNTISITQNGNPYIFRCQTNDEDNVRAAVLFLKQRVNARRVAILHTDDAYGSDAAAALARVSKSGNTQIEVTSDISFSYTATDTTSEWSRAKASNPDGYILWGSGSSMAVALRNARQVGITAPIVGAQGLASAAIIKAAGDAAEGIYTIGLVDPSHITPAQQQVVDLLRKKEGENFQPTLYEYIGWDAVQLFVKAFEKDRKDARSGLESLGSADLAAGTYSFSADSHDGLGLGSIWVNQVKDGKFVGVTSGLS